MPELPVDDARALVQAITDLAAMAQRALPREVPALARRLQAHLGHPEGPLPSSSIALPVVDQANVQLALDAHAATADTWEVVGLPADIEHYHGLSLPDLITGDLHEVRAVAGHYTSVEIGVGETLPCLRTGLLLTSFEGRPLVAMVHHTQQYPPGIEVEVVGATPAHAEAFLRHLRQLIDEHNVYRGKVISFSFDEHGSFGVTFAAVPTVRRDHVILPEGELSAIEDHAVGISARAEQLVAAGQHVKRGLLLHGPPGTGKTHTISYLLGCMPGRTTIILAGAAVSAVGQAGTLARRLQPATIVIEDVDLVGMDRGLPGGEHNSMLFQLLNEMDGLGDDADVLFVLTTNRVDMLEPALAARPGRIDHAVEIPPPDGDARRRLLELYAGELPGGDEGERLVERTDGVTPAFLKELARRATLLGLQRETPVAACLHDALDALLQHASPVLRRTLGAPAAEPGPGDVDVR